MKEWFKNHWKDCVIAIALIAIICFVIGAVRSCDSNRTKDDNIRALMDSVKVLQLSNGELLTEKQSYVLKNKELEEYLGISNKERKEIERKLNSALDKIARMEGQVHIDTVLCHDSIFIKENGDTVIRFEYVDDWTTINGTTGHTGGTYTTTLEEVDMRVPLKVGWTQDRKCFVITDNPHVTFSGIEAAEMNTRDNKPKHWNVGLQMGFGAGYDILHRNLSVGPYIGVGISYGFNF